MYGKSDDINLPHTPVKVSTTPTTPKTPKRKRQHVALLPKRKKLDFEGFEEVQSHWSRPETFLLSQLQKYYISVDKKDFEGLTKSYNKCKNKVAEDLRHKTKTQISAKICYLKSNIGKFNVLVENKL